MFENVRFHLDSRAKPALGFWVVGGGCGGGRVRQLRVVYSQKLGGKVLG